MMKNRQHLQKLMKRVAGKLAGAFGPLLALVLLIGAGASPVLALPGAPHQFWGSVTINNVAAPAGLTVSAKIGITTWATTNTDALGRYGYASAFIVPGDDTTTPAKEGGKLGDNVEFFVGTTSAGTTAFQPGGMTPRNLAITDNAAPPDPTNVQGDRAVSTWSNDNTVTVTWIDSVDTGGSGLDGYSILWDTTSNTIPVATKNIEEGVQTTTSAALADGNSHYFHIRAVDNAGNWVSTVHLGPFFINTAAPADPTDVVGDRATSTWSNDNTVTVTWTDSVDTGGSGLDGYSILWDTSPATIPVATKNIEEGVQTTTSAALADGNSHYFHIRAVDNAGNWVSTVHLGPFFINTAAPADPTDVVGDRATSTWSNDNTVTVTWTDSVDTGGSGLDGYSILWDTSPATIPVATKNIENGVQTTTSAALANGNSHYFHIRAVDNAGNWVSTVHLGPFWIDTTPPVVQKLIGADDAAGTNELIGSLRLSRWQAVATGNMTEFRCKAGASGNIKVALYADSAGQPGALITAMNTAQAVVSGWNTLSFTSTAITSGTYYWLAIVFDTQGCCQAVTTTGVQYRSKAATYSGFSFPNPAGSGFDSYTTFYDLAAGWSSIVAPVPPAVPTRNCSALTFKWNASAGATNYHLQVNTSADFTGTDMSDVDVGNVTSREVTGLTGGTTYYWRVKAGNAAGWSGWSTPTGSMRCE